MGAKDQGADATAGRWLTIPRTLTLLVVQLNLVIITIIASHLQASVFELPALRPYP